MRGEVFSPAVAFTVDDDGDLGVEIIWKDRRLCIDMYPASGEGPSWHFLSKNEGMKSEIGNDLASLMGPFFDLARFQVERDEHRNDAEKAEAIAHIEASRKRAGVR